MTEKPIFRWSFSQWESYNSCPARWKYRSVLKMPSSPPGPAAARGIEMHSECDDYIMGRREQRPLIVAPRYTEILNSFRDHENGDRHCELRLAMDENWSIVGPREPGAALIAVLDAVRVTNDKVVHIGEWKSGKPKDTHGDQRKMYATFGLAKWYYAEEVRVTTYYLEDTAPPAQLIVKPTALPKLISIWDERRSLMQRDQICAPRPGIHCRWCDYAKAKGGPCAFGD
ncbi:MAG TPA: PD-(D/E)XK nuclease family protein [Anaerolineales bacterium]